MPLISYSYNKCTINTISFRDINIALLRTSKDNFKMYFKVSE